MGEDHSPTTTNPHKIMPSTFPYSVDQQLVVDMANSAKETINCLKSVDARTSNIDQFFEVRVHELMRHRPHNVNTDGF